MRLFKDGIDIKWLVVLLTGLLFGIGITTALTSIVSANKLQLQSDTYLELTIKKRY